MALTFFPHLHIGHRSFKLLARLKPKRRSKIRILRGQPSVGSFRKDSSANVEKFPDYGAREETRTSTFSLLGVVVLTTSQERVVEAH